MGYSGIIPQMGFGTWERRGTEGRDAILHALEVGYRHLDTAAAYQNEEQVGQAIAQSKLPREDIWVTTKVWPDNLAPGRVRPSAEASLERLGLAQVDLLLVHWPAIDDEYDIAEYLGQFQEVLSAGLTSHIGVSNFTRKHMDAAANILDDVKILTNQCELHVYFQNRIIADHCANLGVPMTAYCPLARGRIAGDETLDKIASAHGATVGQVALAFLMAEGHVVIPTSSRSDRIAENFGATKIQLSESEVAQIRRLDRNERLVDADFAPQWD